MHHEQAVALLVLLKPLLTQVVARPLEMAPPTVAVVRSSTAKIKWKTPAWSDASVEYGPTTSYGATERTRRHARTHRVVLRGLAPGTVYHYRVSSRDPDGVVVSSDFYFTTPAATAVAGGTTAAVGPRDAIGRAASVPRGRARRMSPG